MSPSLVISLSLFVGFWIGFVFCMFKVRGEFKRLTWELEQLTEKYKKIKVEADRLSQLIEHGRIIVHGKAPDPESPLWGSQDE